jgi:hypothetical protein
MKIKTGEPEKSVPHKIKLSKTEQLWVELQRFYGAFGITEMM